MAFTAFLTHVHASAESFVDIHGPMTECVALIVGERKPGQATERDPEAIFDAVWDALPSAHALVTQTMMFRQSIADKKGGALEAVAARRHALQLVQRQARDVPTELGLIRELFSPSEVKDAIKAQLGFEPSEAVAVVSHIHAGTHMGLGIACDDPGQLRVVGTYEAVATFVLSEDRISDESGLDVAKVAAVVEALSAPTPFGPPKDGFFPPEHALTRAPLLKADDGRFVCAAPTQLATALRLLLEGAAMASNAPAYDAHRSKLAERMAVDPLVAKLRPDAMVRGAKYSFTRDGEQVDGETDGLIVIDDFLFVVEVKAGARKPGAQLKTEARELIDDAAQQADKVIEAIAAGATFTGTDGVTLSASDLAHIREVYPIVVTLEDLSWIAPSLTQAVEAGLLQATRERPWAVSAHDLGLIMTALEFPAQLPHYIAGRRQLDAAGVFIADEVEAFGAYLATGFTRVLRKAQKADGVMLHGGFAEPIEGHARALQLGITTSQLPQRRMTTGRRGRLAKLDTDREPGFLGASVRLLGPI